MTKLMSRNTTCQQQLDVTLEFIRDLSHPINQPAALHSSENQQNQHDQQELANDPRDFADTVSTGIYQGAPNPLSL